MRMRFVWDPAKAESNHRKHGIRFEDAARGIDGVSETDGLEVTSANLGGPWSQGMLVVQDGRKRMPEATQNFKFVPWSEVARALGLE